MTGNLARPVNVMDMSLSLIFICCPMSVLVRGEAVGYTVMVSKAFYESMAVLAEGLWAGKTNPSPELQ